MNTIQEPVTGKETKKLLTLQMKALSSFYQALNNRDMGMMAQNWVPTDEAVMDNPLGGIRRGWNEIKTVYERIFASPARYWFAFYDYSYHESGEVFFVVGRERGQFTTDVTTLDMAIRTSRIFLLFDGEWRQIHHHGSIEDPALLAAYQKAVRTPSPAGDLSSPLSSAGI